MNDSLEGIPGPVLVTGATGFIGRRLTARLLAAGVPTRALVLPGDPVPPSWGDAVAVVAADTRACTQAKGTVSGAEATSGASTSTAREGSSAMIQATPP